MKSRYFFFFHTEGEVAIETQRLMPGNLKEARWLMRLDAIKHQRGEQNKAGCPSPIFVNKVLIEHSSLFVCVSPAVFVLQ